MSMELGGGGGAGSWGPRSASAYVYIKYTLSRLLKKIALTQSYRFFLQNKRACARVC